MFAASLTGHIFALLRQTNGIECGKRELWNWIFFPVLHLIKADCEGCGSAAFGITLKICRRIGGIISGMPNAPAGLSWVVVRPHPGAWRFTCQNPRIFKCCNFCDCGNAACYSEKRWIWFLYWLILFRKGGIMFWKVMVTIYVYDGKTGRKDMVNPGNDTNSMNSIKCSI